MKINWRTGQPAYKDSPIYKAVESMMDDRASFMTARGYRLIDGEWCIVRQMKKGEQRVRALKNGEMIAEFAAGWKW